MRILKIILITILGTLIILPLIVYWYNKTIWKWTTDCMIEYVNNYYPNWCNYTIYWEYRHIDKCWIGNKFMIEENKVKGCMFNNAIDNIFNMPYCYITVLL